MKAVIKKYWQLLLFPLLYIPYDILNSQVIVEWLGCGCPRVDEDGKMIENTFNANHFTLIFWNCIALVVISISIYNMKNISKMYYKFTYIILIVLISVFLSWSFYGLMQWR